MGIGRDVRPRGEVPEAVVEVQAVPFSARICRDQVQVAVLIDVAHHDATRGICVRGDVGRCGKQAVAVVQV